jgi:hypothetical protein
LDVGPPDAHAEATIFRKIAGFERNDSKEIESESGALIKEVPLRRVDGVWVVQTPLKCRVIAGTGNPEVDSPRFVSDFWSLKAECDRQGVSEEVRARAEQFLFQRYGRPLGRVSRFGADVPFLGSGRPEVAWRLKVQDPFGSTDPLLVPPGKGGSQGHHAFLARFKDWAQESEWTMSDPRGEGLRREAVVRELAEEQFFAKDLTPGRTGGAETVSQLLSRLARQAVMGDPSSPWGNTARARLGPQVVSDFPGHEHQVFPARGAWTAYDAWGRATS